MPRGEVILLVSHSEGGGVLRHVQARVAPILAAGRVPWLLRPASFGGDAILQRPGEPDLVFPMPDGLDPLLTLLRGAVAATEVHHLRSHHRALKRLPLLLGRPYRVVIHDWSPFCPRGTLIGADGRYCGEPAVTACERCVAGYDRLDVAAPGGPAALRRTTEELLRQAEAVIVPTSDAARRVARHAPGVRTRIEPWEAPVAPVPADEPPWPRICVAGRIGVHKGFDVLLACARDAASRRLPIDFVLAGLSIDDGALRATGRCAVLGEYPEGRGAAWLRAQRGAIGFLPSIWPETWCYALTVLREAGLTPAAFDIGAQGERLRAEGGLLFPLGLPAGRINDIFIETLTSRGVLRPTAGLAGETALDGR